MSAKATVESILAELDRDHIHGIAQGVRAKWDDGEWCEACYMPGDGTHYGLVFLPLSGLRGRIVGAPGGGTGRMGPHSALGVQDGDKYALVYYVQRNAGMVVGRHEFVIPDRVESYFGTGMASTLALAVLLNTITEQDRHWEARLVASLA